MTTHHHMNEVETGWLGLQGIGVVMTQPSHWHTPSPLLHSSKSYLSEGGKETFTHASTLCLARLAPLAGITLPMNVDSRASPRHMVAALDALPTSLLHPTQVSRPSLLYKL